MSSTQHSIMLSEAKKNQVVSINSHCVNCHNNPEASDRQFILQQFKMACLQYKPSTITYKERVYDRDDILRVKQSMIAELDDIGLTNKTYLSMDIGSLVINVDKPPSSKQSSKHRRYVTPNSRGG